MYLIYRRSSDGESRIAVESMQVTVREIMARALKKRKGLIPTAGKIVTKRGERR